MKQPKPPHPINPATLLGITAASAMLVLPVMPAGAAEPAGTMPSPVKFATHRVGDFRSEACGVGDFNNDGKPDIVAGAYLYLAPAFKAVEIRKLGGKVDDMGKGYRHDFMNLPLDCDGDGRLDVVACDWFAKKAWWCRNPGEFGAIWTDTDIDTTSGNFECGDLRDIDGDGKTAEVLPHVGPTVWYEAVKGADGKTQVVRHVVAENRHDYGAGVGDVNGDGRPDILRPGAWYEAPADPRQGTWTQHPLPIKGHTPQIVVCDVNQDGLPDVVSSIAHGHGIFWLEQVLVDGQRQWKQHEIDKSWSQAHSITLADIDGDGDLDFVTGKRFMAHNGGDPDSLGPLGVYWYELKSGPNPAWIRHAITYDEGIGAGLSIPVVDMDGDGDLDIVVTGKFGGPVWFENLRKSP